MKLRVDVSEVTFLLVRDASPVVDFNTKQAKADEDGVPLWEVQVVALMPGEAEILKVRVPGRPEGLTVNGPVRLEGLTAQPWTMGDRHGVAFRAASVRDGAAAVTGSRSSAGA